MEKARYNRKIHGDAKDKVTPQLDFGERKCVSCPIDRMADLPQNWDKGLIHAVVTDIGMRRSNNQDAHCVAVAGSAENWQKQGHLFIVADGMGAHAAGELASELAVNKVPLHYHKYKDKSPPEALQRAFMEANAEVHRRGQENPDFHNMGTTTSALVLLPQGAVIGHIGDSRVYRVRKDELEQLTFDHSLVWELKAAGQLAEGSDLMNAVPKNVITRSLGPSSHVQADIEGPFPIEQDDIFLLCSDGLTGMVEDHEIGAIMANLPPDEATRVLVDLANLRGGPDNSTVIIVRVCDESLTTRIAAEKPLMIGAEKKDGRRVHPAQWMTLALLVLATLILVLLDQQTAALVSGVLGLGTLAFALRQQFRGLAPGVPLGRGRRLGKGPYTQTSCIPQEEFLHDLDKTIADLLATADKKGIETGNVKELAEAAKDAQSHDDYRGALRHYCRAIMEMMGHFRGRGAA